MTHTSRMQGVHVGAAVVLVLALLTTPGQTNAADGDQTAPRQIPGITTKDAFPNGCVDCHIAGTKSGDMRVSVLMATYAKAVAAPLLAKSKASAADPAKVKGKHPPVPKPGANVPQGCLQVCHKKGSTVAPAFATLMHGIHLTGTPNQFMTTFQGECTHCHKLDQKTGTWRIPSGTEK